MEIHYLAWIRNRVGIANENIPLPDHVQTPQQLTEWLSARDSRYGVLASSQGIINVSVNGQFVGNWNECSLNDKDSVAFFPPMAGG